MKYTQYIVALVAMVFATACTTSDVDEVTIGAAGAKSQLQVVGRVTQYSDCDVATRSKKDGDEPKVSSMGLALFPIENGVVGDCIYYDYKTGGSIVFIVERSDAVFTGYDDKQFAMYIFANMQSAKGFPTTADVGKGMSLNDFISCAYSTTTNIDDVPTDGFPMIGSLGDNASTDANGNFLADGKTLILKPSKDATNPDGLPEVEGNATDNLEIPMEALFAKFSFTISVKPDQEIVGNKAPRFDLVSYQVHNIASTVDCDSTTNSDTDVLDASDSYAPGGYAQGATTATFDFYLPERYLTPANTLESQLPTALKKGTYSEADDADKNGYRDEDEKYHQRFKPLLPGDSKKATYLTIYGKFTDHQGYTYDVSYDIYLGGNNYDNFDIIRNTHYNNSITIRGIATSDDQAVNTNGIAIDHRVEITRSSPLVINLRRETLLDAHFEVRPLRLRVDGTVAEGATATVEVLAADGTTTNIPSWIRLEKADNAISTSHLDSGKRKYFTTDLVTNTLKNSTSATVSLTNANQTVWIYVDEADPRQASTSKSTRDAMIRVTYTDSTGKNNDVKDYIINQYNLHKIVKDNRTYLIECHEEYLYNYDAEDNYGQTVEEGLQWGLNTIKISNEHRSIQASGDLQNWLSSRIRPYYDFYIKKHDSAITSGIQHEYAGQAFTTEIFTKSNGVDVLQMNQQADGAVEYCYNRNKRNDDGSIAAVDWYLPAADELEDIIVVGYSSYKEFQDKYYWTSQPAYIRNYFYYVGFLTGKTHGPLYEENDEYARATRVVSLGNNQYDYITSGLNDKYDGIRDDSGDNVNLGYYYQMPYYNNLSTGIYTEDWKFSIQTGGNRYNYYVHLGHLYDLVQDGYQPRTKKNRIRCVRVAPTTTTTE